VRRLGDVDAGPCSRRTILDAAEQRMVAIHGDHAADFAGFRRTSAAGREHRDLREQRRHERPDGNA